MPQFRPFPALRYAEDIDPARVLAPPYDVLSPEDVTAWQGRNPHNIEWIDMPVDQNYHQAAELLWQWVADGVLTADAVDTLTIYRLSFTDANGAARQIVGVLGGLAVVDPGPAAGVLPHEQTTPKAKTDRLDLTEATATNLSPVWGLSLATGLTKELQAPGQALGEVEIDGVTHRVERISDPQRIARIAAIIAADDVLIADGHHRYAISRAYRDEVRAATGDHHSRAEFTLTFINELIEDQLSIEAIHRVYYGVAAADLQAGLAKCFDFEDLDLVDQSTLKQMVDQGRLVLIWPDGRQQWLLPKAGAFEGVRDLDGAWLEMALADVPVEVQYQHGLAEVQQRLTGMGGDDGKTPTAAILIRPTSIAEIRRTAREGLLMPPKSTFFTPKLLTGWVLRPTEPLPGKAAGV
ncbi:MAG: DUF1015 domain-containing protein [Propionibacteriaceae bacterium]|jgi:uncharacterized protein (DUF1015 family)|nr:DUF1015 domain-containing protein [Propionibacteriaceae bacterium]